MEISLAALPPPPLQRAFHSDPEASQAGSLSAEHLGGMTAAPPPASAYRAPGEATPPPSGRALPSTTLIGFVGCGGGWMPPPSGVAGFRRGGATCPPPSGRGLGSVVGLVDEGLPPLWLSWQTRAQQELPCGSPRRTGVQAEPFRFGASNVSSDFSTLFPSCLAVVVYSCLLPQHRHCLEPLTPGVVLLCHFLLV